MKKYICIIYLLLSVTGILSAQPKLVNLKFKDGTTITSRVSYGKYTIELKFDQLMNRFSSPVVYFSKDESYSQKLDTKSGSWVDDFTWQGQFSITNEIPSSARGSDGEYRFKIIGAKSTEGLTMEETLSTSIGTGVTLFICRTGSASLSTAALSFAEVTAGTSQRLSFTIRNTNCADLVISSFTISKPFSLVENIAQKTIRQDQTLQVEVIFSPKERQKYSGELTIQTNDRVQSVQKVALDGSAGGPNLTLSRNELDFGTIEAGTFKNKTILLSNRVAIPAELGRNLQISALTLSDSTQFKLNNTLAVLEPGTAGQLSISFNPQNPGDFSGSYLTISSNDLTQPDLKVMLNGKSIDTIPPQIPQNMAPAWTGQPGFTGGDSLQICWDLLQDPSGIAEMRWKISAEKAPPLTVDDTTGLGGRGFLSKGQTCFTIPLSDKIGSGYWHFYIWFVDGSQNSGFAKPLYQPFFYDLKKPKMKFPVTMDAVATFGQPFKRKIVVLDDAGIEAVNIAYRPAGSKAAGQTIPVLRQTNSDTFQINLPATALTSRSLEFKVTALDSSGSTSNIIANYSTCSQSIWYPLAVRLTGDGDYLRSQDGAKLPLKSGSNGNNYQLFSVPYYPDSASVLSVLGDDLGEYNTKQWRLFDYNPQNTSDNQWVEGLDARDFKPGRAYFVITRKKNTLIDAGPGLSTLSVCPDSIRLYDGWNLVATPFAFPVHTSSISTPGATPSLTLYDFDNGWTETNIMQPWKGYAVYITRAAATPEKDPLYFVVQPVEAQASMAKSQSRPRVNDDEWMVRMSAESVSLHDRENWIGLRHGAQAGLDHLEKPEPPVIGEYVRLSFSSQDESENLKYSTDFRPIDRSDALWEFEVETSLSKEPIHLNFEFIGKPLDGKKVLLVDPRANITKDLTQSPTYTFVAGQQYNIRRFKIVFGDEEYIEAESEGIALVPETTELSQNYPNPFNPHTSIKFSLSSTQRVSLVIYDQLGRKVRTLLGDAEHSVGHHVILWDGRNNMGQKVASGVYTYRLLTSSETLARQMVLLR